MLLGFVIVPLIGVVVILTFVTFFVTKRRGGSVLEPAPPPPLSEVGRAMGPSVGMPDAPGETEAFRDDPSSGGQSTLGRQPRQDEEGLPELDALALREEVQQIRDLQDLEELVSELAEEEAEAQAEAEAEEIPEEVAPVVRPRFKDRLGRARLAIGGRLVDLRRKGVDESVWEEVEEVLLLADVGIATTTRFVDELRAKAAAREVKSGDEVVKALRAILVREMSRGDHTLDRGEGNANVWLFVGVNGVGKTTTIAKVGLLESKAGRKVVMAAADTFRAAAAEQLEHWSDMVGADFVRGAEGGDPGAVVFDAVQRAAARSEELVLADTAGRLHNKANLMEELKKVRRVAERPPGNVREVLLVIDATTGQNGLVQARGFADAVGVTGVVLTKLDGTAKGGIAVAIQEEMGLPIKLVGLGEGPGDLVDFDAEEFVDAILGTERDSV